MRAILWIVLGLGVLWSGYWLAGSRMIESGVAEWFANSEQTGIEASQTGIAVAGFANRFDLTVTNPELRDSATGWGWRAPFAQVLAMTWKPWHVIAALPNSQTILAPLQSIEVTSTKMDASLRLVPSTDLPLAEIVFAGADVLARSDLGWQIGAKSVVAAVAQSGVADQRVGLDVTDLTPDPALTATLSDLGPTISGLHLDATLTLSAPLDRHVAQTRPRLTSVRVTDFRLSWGKMTITAKGDVAPDAGGLAEGKIAVRFEHWRSIPELFVQAGLVLPGMGDTIARGLDALARSGRDPEVLSIDLVFADGRMNFGPLPLGPAPRFN